MTKRKVTAAEYEAAMEDAAEDPGTVVDPTLDSYALMVAIMRNWIIIIENIVKEGGK